MKLSLMLKALLGSCVLIAAAAQAGDINSQVIEAKPAAIAAAPGKLVYIHPKTNELVGFAVTKEQNIVAQKLAKEYGAQLPAGLDLQVTPDGLLIIDAPPVALPYPYVTSSQY